MVTHENKDGDVEKEIRILLSRKTHQNQPGIKPQKTTRQRKKDYMQKKGTRRQKGITKEVEHIDWNAAHKDNTPETRQQQGRAGQCTRCGMTNHTWRQCRRQVVISTVGQRKLFQPQKCGFSGFRSNRPQISWTLRIQNHVPKQINQIVRPKSWETDMDEQ